MYAHLVWSTKRREPFIDVELEARLHPFLGGIARDLGCPCLAINGTSDHVHMLVRLRVDTAMSDLLRHLKSRSSKWIHEDVTERSRFAWQAGYGGFSVSTSKVDEVLAYIERQKEHHQALSFEHEFMELLRRHGFSPAAAEVFQDD